MQLTRKVKSFAEYVKSEDLVVGRLYFFVHFLDADGHVPELRPVVFVGRDLEPNETGVIYFQDYDSHEAGVRYGHAIQDGQDEQRAQFYCGPCESPIALEFEDALDVMINCSVSRSRTKVSQSAASTESEGELEETRLSNEPRVDLDMATPEDATLLASLLEFYQHDMSEYFPVDLRTDGRFGYDRLPLYWSDPSHRFPFLIRSDDRVVGFALATHGSPAAPDDPNVYDVAEFFVLRRYRRGGIAQRAARLLWRRYEGKWVVRVSERNAAALEFWRHAILEYGPQDVRQERKEDLPGWVIFTFTSRADVNR